MITLPNSKMPMEKNMGNCIKCGKDTAETNQRSAVFCEDCNFALTNKYNATRQRFERAKLKVSAMTKRFCKQNFNMCGGCYLAKFDLCNILLDLSLSD